MLPQILLTLVAMAIFAGVFILLWHPKENVMVVGEPIIDAEDYDLLNREAHNDKTFIAQREFERYSPPPYPVKQEKIRSITVDPAFKLDVPSASLNAVPTQTEFDRVVRRVFDAPIPKSQLLIRNRSDWF